MGERLIERQGETMRLLLVEDDAMIGAGIRSGLHHEEFAVDWVQVPMRERV